MTIINTNKIIGVNKDFGATTQFVLTAGVVDPGNCFWFPTTGHAMTDNSSQSIPDGSKVMARELKPKDAIPINKPILFSGTNRAGHKFRMVAVVSSVDHKANIILVRYYNLDYKPFYIHRRNISRIFEVERVCTPYGQEFDTRKSFKELRN